MTLPERVSEWEGAAWEARTERIAIMVADGIPEWRAIALATERVRVEWRRKAPACPQDALKATG